MKREIVDLRKRMKETGVDIYIVPTGDFHGSEYIHDYFKTREFLSGFTGSAGTLIVTQDEARLCVDSRYFLQAAEELADSGIELMKLGLPETPEIQDYLKDALAASAANRRSSGSSEGPASVFGEESTFGFAYGPTLGFDGRIVSTSAAREYEEQVKEVGGRILSELDLAGDVWENRPSLSGNPIWELPLSSAGLPYEIKIAEVRTLMDDVGATHHLITKLEDNAWIYNLRGSDVARTPVFFSFTLITPDSVNLYIFDDACPKDLIPQGVTVKNYFDLKDDLAALPANSVLLTSPEDTSYALLSAVPEDVEILEEKFGPVIRLKSSKNPIEIEATREAHINDGAAMVNFIAWLKANVGKTEISEISAADYLEKQRAAQPGFISLSFDTIAGYGPHGAIVHYSATPETDALLKPEGFLLLDSGGQYINGTTDTTRTIALGPLTDHMKKSYTAVLKGHLALAMCKFNEGTIGRDLDKIAKAPLKELGFDYMHGTGHGVGHVLCVHEGPQSISEARGTEPIIPGMVTSDEPGYYPEGEFGVRIENEILCVVDETGENDYRFDMLTCCPYEREAIEKELLSDEETTYINDYHAWVCQAIKPRVAPDVALWLEEACQPI